MAAYRRVYDSRHLQADCQELGSIGDCYKFPTESNGERILTFGKVGTGV